MCHPLQAKRSSPSEDFLKQGWRIAKLAGVQAHANNKMEKVLCLQQFRQQVISTVPLMAQEMSFENSRAVAPVINNANLQGACSKRDV